MRELSPAGKGESVFILSPAGRQIKRRKHRLDGDVAHVGGRNLRDFSAGPPGPGEFFPKDRRSRNAEDGRQMGHAGIVAQIERSFGKGERRAPGTAGRSRRSHPGGGTPAVHWTFKDDSASPRTTAPGKSRGRQRPDGLPETTARPALEAASRSRVNDGVSSAGSRNPFRTPRPRGRRRRIQKARREVPNSIPPPSPSKRNESGIESRCPDRREQSKSLLPAIVLPRSAETADNETSRRPNRFPPDPA